jgi:DNA-binding CsgD family transcriptional regulator
MSHNEAWAIDELAEADRAADTVAWASTIGEERLGLVSLAVLYAPHDAVRAQRYASTYSQLGTESVAPTFDLHGNRRAVAHAKYAQGRIEQTLGRRDAAVKFLTDAYTIFDECSYHYRSALAAAALAALTGETSWRDASIRHAGRYPDCPLASYADDSVAREEAFPRDLSPLQRQIARALWTGSDAAEISRRFSRSLYTIQQHISTVFDAFGVASRNALLVEARHRDLA